VKARGVPSGYVEGLNDARTKLAGFFSILLEWAAMSWIDGIWGLTEGQWVTVGFMSSALAVWHMRTRAKTKTK
jgi:hypothetical protein